MMEAGTRSDAPRVERETIPVIPIRSPEAAVEAFMLNRKTFGGRGGTGCSEQTLATYRHLLLTGGSSWAKACGSGHEERRNAMRRGVGAGLIVGLVLGMATATLAQAPSWVFWSGNTYHARTPAEQRIYATGVIDAIRLPQFGSKATAQSCMVKHPIPSIEADKLFAVVDQYMAARPEKWQSPAADLVAQAITAMCRY